MTAADGFQARHSEQLVRRDELVLQQQAVLGLEHFLANVEESRFVRQLDHDGAAEQEVEAGHQLVGIRSVLVFPELVQKTDDGRCSAVIRIGIGSVAGIECG